MTLFRSNPRQALIAFVTFIGGLYFFLEYVLPKSSGIGAYHDQLSTAVQVIGSMAVGLGIINILKVHGGKLLRARPGWINSLALLFGMILTLGIGTLDLIESQRSAIHRREFDTLVAFIAKISDSFKNSSSELASQQIQAMSQTLDRLSSTFALSPDSESASTRESIAAQTKLLEAISQSKLILSPLADAKSNEQREIEREKLTHSLLAAASLAQEYASAKREVSSIKKTQELLQQGFVESLGSAMFALLAFYIANAAYRAFRVRSLEAAAMMTAALIVMLGQIPFGPLYISDKLPVWRLWLIETISTPAFRAIYFGATIAGLSMAVRMWLSLERSPLSDSTEGGGLSGGKR